MARQKANVGSTEAAAERRVKALELRKAALPYRVIAQQLNVSESQAHRDVMGALKALAKLEREGAKEVRQLELERVDSLMSALWTRARGRRVQHADGTQEDIPPDLAAMDRLMKLMERRVKLLGIDVQPEKDPVDTEIVVRVVYGDGEPGKG